MRIAGRPAGPHLRARVPELTRRVVARLRAELPVYAELPGEELTGDIADIVQHNLRLFADCVEHRRPATETELDQQRDSAAQRAEEGVPLDAILTAYHIGTILCWQEISADARPHELADVQETVDRMMELQRRLTSAVSAAYLEARSILDRQEHDGRHALLAALLAGEPARLGPTGPRPAALYVAMTLALGTHPDETVAGPGAGIAARRKTRRVRSVLDRHTGEPALTALDATGGTVLLPVAEPPSWDGLRALVERAGESAGVPVTAAATVAAPHEVAPAVTRNAEVVDLVRRTRRPPGLYRLADVLLDYQLSRPSAALDDLAALLAPIEERPGLLHTLQTFLDEGLDRRAAAAALHVHPNTVDYRLRSIARLTGLSPVRPADLPQLGAALVARRARAGAPGEARGAGAGSGPVPAS
ncbi:PucR family transcriptional regulator [Streptomyces triticagri]|uniref:PucR family transcriptional regulator n=1 Tax=Streptomyces triticagri TaxID=2293568 RepID=A0A372M2Y4_9ACTN|nr:helix-turn-helix domain-containing protein [Streptomyces triticagri]RFU85288.1 PucR family transcriptional regulator [Streptomyces triticagri]